MGPFGVPPLPPTVAGTLSPLAGEAAGTGNGEGGEDSSIVSPLRDGEAGHREQQS
jgi:hypothetical protein